MAENVDEVGGGFAEDAEFRDDDADVRDDDAEDEEKPRWNGRGVVRIPNCVIVAEEAPFGRWKGRGICAYSTVQFSTVE